MRFFECFIGRRMEGGVFFFRGSFVILYLEL